MKSFYHVSSFFIIFHHFHHFSSVLPVFHDFHTFSMPFHEVKCIGNTGKSREKHPFRMMLDEMIEMLDA